MWMNSLLKIVLNKYTFLFSFFDKTHSALFDIIRVLEALEEPMSLVLRASDRAGESDCLCFRGSSETSNIAQCSSCKNTNQTGTHFSITFCVHDEHKCFL